MNKRLVIFKSILWSLAGLAAAVAVMRFAFGLGAATNLSDSTPWGLWIGFDVMGGVALAAGGFVMAALVHIFHRDKYHPAARPAILTAFLGYGAVAVGLLFDLGLPWNIWHPMIFWNIHSPLFEVAWCVMLYLTVLALEVAPFILERTPFQKLYRFFRKLALPVMILGIMLSTLHQSSLGSLLLIMPFRVHPLWYTHFLPEFFFASAICLGLCMVMFESCITSWLYRRKPEMEMLSGLAKIAAWALGFCLLFRVGDLAVQGKLSMAFEGSWVSNLFLFEVMITGLLPVVLFSLSAVRRSFGALWFAASLPVLGFVLHRINASGLSQVWATDAFYFPAWTEFSISLGIVSGCALVFFFIQEHFPVDPHELDAMEEERRRADRRTPEFSPFSQIWLGEGWRKDAKVYSMLFILALAVGLSLAPRESAVASMPAEEGRGRDVLRLGVAEPFVYFDHTRHQKLNVGRESCGVCHHLNRVGDLGTPCAECHRSMYEPSPLFDHDHHVEKLGGNDSCDRCHEPGSRAHLAATKTCSSCHEKDMMADNPVVRKFDSLEAGPYKEALHKMCIPCHVKMDELKGEGENLQLCGTCHDRGTKSEAAFFEWLERRKRNEQ